jgi:hypothetical protein
VSEAYAIETTVEGYAVETSVHATALSPSEVTAYGVEVVETPVPVFAVASQGPPGPPGMPGRGLGFEADFAAAAEWVVNHNLGFRPLVSVLTPGGAEMDAEVLHTSLNQCRVYFSAPAAGRVRCV